MKWLNTPIGIIAPPQSSARCLPPDSEVWQLSLDQIESDTGRIIDKKTGFVKERGSSTYVFDSGNILYSKLRPYLNKVACPNEVGIATTELVPLRPQEKLVDRRYLTYYLRSPIFVSFATVTVAGVKMPRIIMNKFWEHQIPLPTLTEQRRIVEILDQANTLRQLRREADEKAQHILPALFYQMFGDPIANLRRWETVSFAEAMHDCTAQCPKLQRKEYLVKGRFPVIDQGQEFVAGYTDSESLLTTPKCPVVVFGDHTRVVKLVSNPFVVGADGAKVLSVRPGMIPGFLAALLQLSPIPNLGYSRHMRVVKELTFIRPPLELQNRFSEWAHVIRKLVSRQGQSNAKIKEESSILLHRAFTGELTAKWREARRDKLEVEMQSQTKLLADSAPHSAKCGRKRRNP
jgi:type I restriction enzyme S subunit